MRIIYIFVWHTRGERGFFILRESDNDISKNVQKAWL